MSLEDLERELEATSEYNESSPVSTLETQKDLSPKVLAQYSIDGDGVYEATGSTTKKLPPGFYEFKEIRGRMFFSRIDSKNDRLIRIKDSLADSIMNEVNMFWSKQSIFKKYGFTHHRGYLLYGAHGSGKTCLVQMIGQDIIDAGGVVFICSYPPAFIAGIKIFRQVEPDRNCVCIFEDIEAMIKAYGDTDLLSYLDGEYKIDRALNIATTNYPELLDKRIAGRPRRFDRVIKVDYPDEQSRHAYFEKKLTKTEAIKWAKATEQLSFASLAELIISVKCLGNQLQTTIELLREMQTKFTPISEGVEKIGFGK